MANVRPKSFEEVLSVGMTPMQLKAVNDLARKRRWSQASLNRYAIVKELISARIYNPKDDPENNEDFDDLILEDT